jgi:hypothetical protein
MKKDNNNSKKHDNKYKKIKYKRTGQILKSNREVSINNTNINNRSDKKKQLIKTLIDKNQFEGVLTNCL